MEKKKEKKNKTNKQTNLTWLRNCSDKHAYKYFFIINVTNTKLKC